MSPDAPADALWTLALALADARRAGRLAAGPAGFRLDADGALRVETGAEGVRDPRCPIVRRDDGRFAAGPATEETVATGRSRTLVELCLPLLEARPARPVVLAHLGQSLDGCIATASGDSTTVTGEEDFAHMHRLRALADAVLVGAGTVAADDPRLTTRLVAGPSPTRVVLDPRGRLSPTAGVFTDGAAPTLWVRAEREPVPSSNEPGDGVEVVRVADDADGGLSLPALLETLGERGLDALFIEGGGVTVARWLAADRLDRLQIAVAPVIVGDGRRALPLPSAATMNESRRPVTRTYRLGRDVLWDLDLRAGRADGDRR